MKKILVSTDFSANSKSGVRFAIRWASEQKVNLVFIHVLNVLKATSWSGAYFEKYAAQQEVLCRSKLEKFVAGIYNSMNTKPGKHSFEIIQGISADISILDYCRKNHGIDYICISTRGAGKFNKIFGTNTGNLITKSAVPVMAVPKNYRVAQVKSVMYAADLRNYPEEIQRVVDFAQPFKANIDVLHFTWPDEITIDKKIMETAAGKKYKYGMKVHLEKNDAVHSLIQNIQSQIQIRKPSVVVMFTNQKRTFFQRLFLSSKAEELSFEAKVPLLVFNKN